jgi:hypothetical protein
MKALVYIFSFIIERGSGSYIMLQTKWEHAEVKFPVLRPRSVDDIARGTESSSLRIWFLRGTQYAGWKPTFYITSCMEEKVNLNFSLGGRE